MGELSVSQFERRYRDLLSTLAHERDNDACIECVGCAACAGSTFCSDSERLVRCHYCIRCSMCTDCSHCRLSRSLFSCQHCIDCENCASSSYLLRCVALTDCSYCFGCVGLSRRDFHVLNEPCDQAEYFRLTRRLAQELGL